MRTRKKDWIDLKTLKPAYGFQVFYDGKWFDASDGEKPCIFSSDKERDAKQAEVSKLKA